MCATRGLAPVEVGRAFLDAGVGLVQVRAKSWPAGACLALVDALAPMAAARGAHLIVNDRVDIALSAGVGVHLGQTDLPVEEARRLLGPAATIGISTHSPAELDAALSTSASYIAYGPIFPTASKASPDPVVGLDGLRSAAARIHAAGRPAVAIGGISLATVREVWRAGADAAAVIGDLCRGPETVAVRTAQFLQIARNQPV